MGVTVEVAAQVGMMKMAVTDMQSIRGYRRQMVVIEDTRVIREGGDRLVMSDNVQVAASMVGTTTAAVPIC